MGMTIEKAINRLEDLHFEQDNWEYGELTEDCLLNREALRLAIDTMRKYQKIQKIVSDFREYQKGISCGFGGAAYMQMVSEVVEDGENND